MAVHHGVDVRSRLVDLAVDVALADQVVRAPIDRPAVEIELDDVVRRHQLRRQRPRQEVTLGIGRRPHADVPPGIDDAVFGQDAIGDHEVFDQAHGCFRPSTTKFIRA